MEWDIHPDQTSPMTVGPDDFFDDKFDKPQPTDSPLQSAAREAGWVLSELVDGIAFEKRQNVVNIINRLSAALAYSDNLKSSEYPKDIVKLSHEFCRSCTSVNSDNYFDIRDAIARAILAEREHNRWATIESAPFDGTRVLCWNINWEVPETGCMYGMFWASSGLAAEIGGWKYQPTHWQPLPEPPETP